MKVCVKQSLLMLSLLVALPAKAVVSPGQNMWGIVQETANTVEIMSETVSIFDSTFTSFIDSGCDLALTNSMISVVDSKVDKLSNSLFPVLATLATASSITPLATAVAVSVVDSKVDKLSTSIFPVLSTILSDVSFPTPITTSMTITTSGSYILANNIQGTITINADSVTLDLNGFTITPPGATGVSISTGHKNIWVKNGFIANGTNGIVVATNNSDFVISDIEISGMTSRGINMIATDTTSSTIQRFTIKNCSIRNVSNNGILLVNGINSEISNCVLEVCGSPSFLLNVTCVNILVEDCKVQKSSGDGFFVGGSFRCTFNRCIALESSGIGFSLGTSFKCSFNSCQSMHNGSIGFSALADNLFVNNFAYNNGGGNYTGVTNAALTSFGDAAMNYWLNYQAP